jgi:hypothetical protein
MVVLLVGLGVAVLYQIVRQGWHLLGSVSAYYYTPAQAIFVGALIGLGACMIALKGTNDVEDVFLNLGGMFAAVVAIVPTARGEDYRTAVRACKQAAGPLLTRKASTGLDCPTVQTLADATRANVENNMVALLVMGALGLLATVFFALRYRSSNRSVGRSGVASMDPDSPRNGLRPTFWWGFGAALVVWAVGAVVFWAYTQWFVDHAHYLAAAGLFACILVVAVANAFRRQGKQQPSGASALDRSMKAVGAATDALIRPGRRDPYAWLSWLMVGAAVVGTVLVLSHRISLFWLEIVVAFLFVVFWTVQTVERLPRQAADTADL